MTALKVVLCLALLHLLSLSALCADQTVTIATTNWNRVDFTNAWFSTRLLFSIPPGMTKVPVERREDILQGQCVSTNLLLQFHYNWLDPLPGHPNYGPPEIVFLDGHLSKMWVLPNNVLYLLVRDVIGKNSLRMIIRYKSPADVPIAKAIVESIRFEEAQASTSLTPRRWPRL